MRLLRRFVADEAPELLAAGIRLKTIGALARLPAFARVPLAALEAATASNRGMTLCLALSYGGREAITAAARALAHDAAAGRLDAARLTQATLGARLGTAELPDVDLIIRTSGEQRLSNFLLWEAAYAELWFTPTLWPDFDRDGLEAALEDYGRRQRRFGRLTAGGPDASPAAARPGSAPCRPGCPGPAVHAGPPPPAPARSRERSP
jgi:undecaprenyl diphosphate synthase